jgi:hypothetical protein
MQPSVLLPVDCWDMGSQGRNRDDGKAAVGHGPGGQGGHSAPGPPPPGALGPPSGGPPGHPLQEDQSESDDNPKTVYVVPVATSTLQTVGTGTSRSPPQATTSASTNVNLPFFNFAPNSPLSSILSMPALPSPTWDLENRIYFNTDCRAAVDNCEGMTETLNLAGWYISQVPPPRYVTFLTQIIQLRSPLIVNASFTDFCAAYGVCGLSAETDTVLAGAVPARTFPLVDDDGVVRFYPQAAVRQMDFPRNQTPQFGSCDILVEFNSNANFWFPYPNTTAINSAQYDFLVIALHEYCPWRGS